MTWPRSTNRDNGYLPEATLNFLAFLGWSLDDHTTHITPEEFTRVFSLDRVVSNPAFFDVERLDALNGHYIRALDPAAWRDLVAEWLDHGLPADIPRPLDADLVTAVAPLLQERVARLDEVAGLSRFLFAGLPDYPAELLTERIKGDTELAARTLDAAIAAIEAVSPDVWAPEPVEAAPAFPSRMRST